MSNKSKHLYSTFIIIITLVCLIVFQPAMISRANDNAITPAISEKDAPWISYSYNQNNLVTIDGKTYPGIVIPINKKYSNTITVTGYEMVPYLDGYLQEPTISSTSGDVYGGIFDSTTFTSSKFELMNCGCVSDPMSDIGQKYLVFFTVNADKSFTTNIKIKCYYSDISYGMQLGKTYSLRVSKTGASQITRITITKPGIYFIKGNSPMIINGTGPADEHEGHPSLAYNLNLSKQNDYESLVRVMTACTYTLNLKPTDSSEFNLSISYYSDLVNSPKTTISSKHPVTVSLGDSSNIIYKFKATKTGIIYFTGTALDKNKVDIDLLSKPAYNSELSSNTMTFGKNGKATEAVMFNVKKGKTYYLVFDPASKNHAVKFTFRIKGYKVLKKPIPYTTLKSAKKHPVKLKHKYTGGNIYHNHSAAIYYVNKPVRYTMSVFGPAKNTKYSITYYSLKLHRKVYIGFVNPNTAATNIVLDSWTPGYFAISNMGTENSYYEITFKKYKKKK